MAPARTGRVSLLVRILTMWLFAWNGISTGAPGHPAAVVAVPLVSAGCDGGRGGARPDPGRSPEERLRGALQDSSVKSYTLTENVVLTQTLPAVSRDLTLKGRCKARNGRPTACVIDGRDRVRGLFASNCKLSLLNLHLTRFLVTRAQNVTDFYEDQEHFGGAVYFKNTSLSIANCLFSLNRAKVGYGGALAGIASRVAIAQSRFEKNRADNDGGGMFLWNVRGSVVGTTFASNSAAGSGGAIATIGGLALAIRNSAFTRNSAGKTAGSLNIASNIEPSVITSSSFSANVAAQGGGAIGVVLSRDEDDDDSVHICWPTFRGNKVVDVSGAASSNVKVQVFDQEGTVYEQVHFCKAIPTGVYTNRPDNVVVGCSRCRR